MDSGHGYMSLAYRLNIARNINLGSGILMLNGGHIIKLCEAGGCLSCEPVLIMH